MGGHLCVEWAIDVSEASASLIAPGTRSIAQGLLVLCWLTTAGCAAFEPARAPLRAVPAAPALPGVITHTVLPGETLWAVGRRYGVRHQDIMQANGIADPGSLRVGQRLIIPRAIPSRPVLSVPLYPNPRWTHIVIHHTATTEGNARLLDRAHRRRGFSNGLGYHFVINNGTSGRADGRLEVGHRWTRQETGAHCNAGGMNHHGIGIVLVGNFMEQPPSSAQLATLAALVERLSAYYRISLNRIIRHRDVAGKNTACPGRMFPWTTFRSHLFRNP